MSVADLVSTRRVIVCVGRGGVGKTTLAAALGILGAVRGRRTMVLTIDPARRLAQSLGLETLPRGGARIDDALLAGAGLAPRAPLDAGMLDARRTWDDLVAHLAPTPALREAILGNDFYRHLSSTFAGSTEYAAIEALWEVVQAGKHDLVVLDTPPAAHAVSFLEAPRRLEDFLEADLVSWIVGLRSVAGGGEAAGPWAGLRRMWRALAGRIEAATGTVALTQIAAFFEAFGQVLDRVTERSHRVERLLRGEETAFVLVAAAGEALLEADESFARRMDDLGLGLKAVVVNRAHPLTRDDDALPSPEAVRADLAARLPDVADEVAGWLLAVYGSAREAARREAALLEAARLRVGPELPIEVVPEQAGDVHDLGRLAEIVARLDG